MQYYCADTTFGSYADLISRDGKSYIKKQNNVTPFTHYMICKAKRLSLISAVVDGAVQINLRRHVPGFQFEEQSITLHSQINGRHIASVEGDYPEIKVTLDDASTWCFANLFEFLAQSVVTHEDSDFVQDLLDLEVIYVGKTEIKGNYIRIDGHEKYAKAADAVSKNEPENELFIKLLHFDPPDFIVEGEEAPEGELQENLRKAIGKIPRGQWISLVEAALIYELQPALNIHYRKFFPDKTHSSYSFFLKAKKLDGVRVEVNENLRAYSTRQPGKKRTRWVISEAQLR